MPKEIIWTEENIKNGFEKFFQEYGHHPTTLEIDSFPGLPSSKQLQRRFGGVKNLREKLGLNETDFRTGLNRANVAKSIGKRGLEQEKIIQNLLIKKFGEICVHEQKPFNDYSGRLDFVVYTKNKKFGIDVFYPKDRYNLIGCINAKERIYENLDFEIILLQMNNNIAQEIIDHFIENKKNELAQHIFIFSYQKFIKFIDHLEPLR